MSNGKRFCSKLPHLDIEQRYPRNPIPFYINHPDRGMDDKTGLIFTITGFGMHPEQEYECKLRDYLANKYNCIVVGVDYFGCSIKHPRLENMVFSDGFFEALESQCKINLEKMSQLPIAKALSLMARYLQPLGVKRFEYPMYLVDKDPCVYQSFGVLPALDYLQVLQELLEQYTLNKQRLYILGTSYGGYIGLLLGKLAPNTFRFIVDNAGFSEADLSEVYGMHNRIGSWVEICGFETFLMTYSPWVQDTDSPHCFCEHHKEIRSLLVAEHILPSRTEYYCFHSREDTVAPVEHKEQFKAMRKEMDIELEIISEQQVDGRVFKHIEHGMGASLRGLFDLAYDAHQKKAVQHSSQTDFDLESEFLFRCSNHRDYRIKFDCNNIQLEIHKQ